MPSCTATPTFAVYIATLDEYPHHFSDNGADCQHGGGLGEGGGGEGGGSKGGGDEDGGLDGGSDGEA